MRPDGCHIFSVRLDHDHPACEGHFEGNPLLPGVITLEYVRLACKEIYPKLQIKSFSRAKFTHSLKPGETLAIHLSREKDGIVDFQCFDSKNHQSALGKLLAE